MSTQTPCLLPNHHLWRNKRFWWTAFTVIRDGYHQIRVRESLRTEDVELARQRRDARMRYYADLPNHEVVCLSRSAGRTERSSKDGEGDERRDAGPTDSCGQT